MGDVVLLRRLLVAAVCALVLGGTQSAAADAPPRDRVLNEMGKRFAALADDAEAAELDAISDDPVTLRALALKLRPTDEALATRVFDHATASEEINNYERFAGSAYAAAARQQAFGDVEGAKATWLAAAQVDPLTTYILAARYARGDLRTEVLATVRQQVETLFTTAKAGQPATIYQTKKGSKRNLVPMTNEEALERLQAGESLRYAAIDKLDLTNQTFESPVGCSRCVIGELAGWSSTYTGFSFRGFVLGNFHLGKSWTGKVNKSRSLPAAKIDELLLDKAVVFGDVELDSVEIGKFAGFPFLAATGEIDLRNAVISGDLDMRFVSTDAALTLEGASLRGAGYFGHVHAGSLSLSRTTSTTKPLLFDSSHFTGAVTAARCRLDHGATFENARFDGVVDMHHCAIGTRLNLSRAHFGGAVRLAYVELDDVDALGAYAADSFTLKDSVVRGNARFALDGFTRREHLSDPGPLHTLYKQYQGDVDADTLLTESSQYGVVHVDDLSVHFGADTSFANTYFQKFVGFEGVTFGSSDTPTVASFYNAQLQGEAHFERTNFHAIGDFRTISGNELSFNGARFHRTWMLDDANVPGRLSLTDLTFGDQATLSFRGARLASFGITMDDVLQPNKDSRLFYERCVRTGSVELEDDRMLAARWDEAKEADRPKAQAQSHAERLCMDFAIAEFVVLRDSFTKRGMTQEADWAYWNLRHYTNLRDRTYAEGPLQSAAAWGQWLFFEKAFGWGVRLENLFWSSLLVILFYMLLFRTLCPSVLVDWDDATMPLKDLPRHALFVISLHSFLGRARDWKSKSSNKVWKVLYTTEMIIGILLITFFIGAYARIILR